VIIRCCTLSSRSSFQGSSYRAVGDVGSTSVDTLRMKLSAISLLWCSVLGLRTARPAAAASSMVRALAARKEQSGKSRPFGRANRTWPMKGLWKISCNSALSPADTKHTGVWSSQQSLAVQPACSKVCPYDVFNK
jgi:hypothetical protein